MSNPINNRYDFVLFFDCTNGNPNGDPDAGNLPRVDPETGVGIVTDVSLKRKIRNYVEMVKQDATGFKIYIKEAVPLNTQHTFAYTVTNTPLPKDDKERKSMRNDAVAVNVLRKAMCDNFYDVRTFGAVMSTEVNCGRVTGPVQLNFANSIDPVMPQELTITRLTVTQENAEKSQDMGRKYIIPYGLYRVEGYVSARLANDPARGTGFSEEDLELLWDALINMFDHAHSSGSGKVASRKLLVFKHESDMGNAPSHKLFDLVHCALKKADAPARHFTDYEIVVDEKSIPNGVTLLKKLE